MHHAIAMPAPAGLAALTDLERCYFGYLADYRGRTLATYERNLQQYLTWCGINRVDPMTAERTHVAMYVRHLMDDLGVRGSTVNTYITPVKGMYKWAFIEGFLDRDPAVHVKLPKSDYRSKYPLERHELRAIRRAAKHLGGRHWALGELLVAHGLRITECCELMIEDCQDTERGHRIMKLKRKGGKVEHIPMPIPVAMAIDDAAGDRRRGPVLLTRDGRPMIRNTAVGLLRTICRHANIERHVNPHLIRASSVTLLVTGDGGVYEGQRFAGHEDPRTTSRHYDLSKHDHDTHPVHVLSARLTA